MAIKKKSANVSPELLGQFEKIVSSIPGIERKGDSVPYTSVNGNMFAYLDKEGKLALRLPVEERNEFLKKHKAKLQEAYGIIQKEYVAVPAEVFENITLMKKYFAASYAYAKALKPKPTTKTKKNDSGEGSLIRTVKVPTSD